MCQHEMVDEPCTQPIPDSDEAGVRIPLSLGEVKEDNDKSGNICQVYDIIWNPIAVKRAQEEPSFRQLMVELAVAHIKQKRKHELSISISLNRIYRSKYEIQRKAGKHTKNKREESSKN